MPSIRIAGWRTSWNQIEYIKTNAKKSPKNRMNNFNVEVLLNVIEFLLCAWAKHVCIAACAHHSMQTHQTRNANVALFQSGLLRTIYGCNKLYISNKHCSACEESSSMCIIFTLKLFIVCVKDLKKESSVRWRGMSKIHYKCSNN